MSPRTRSVVLLGVVVLMLLAGYFLQKLDSGEAAPGIPSAELTPGSTDATTATPSTGGTAATSSPIVVGATKSPTATALPAGRRDLAGDESRGGHTLARHVGRSDAELAARLKAEPDISAASTYTDRETAERAVATVLSQKAADVKTWENKTGNRANLALRASLNTNVGRSLKRGASTAVDVHSVVVVLAWKNDGWFVLTSYPEDR